MAALAPVAPRGPVEAVLADAGPALLVADLLHGALGVAAAGGAVRVVVVAVPALVALPPPVVGLALALPRRPVAVVVPGAQGGVAFAG